MIALTLFSALCFIAFRRIAVSLYDPILGLFGREQPTSYYVFCILTALSFLAAAGTLILWAYWNLP